MESSWHAEHLARRALGMQSTWHAAHLACQASADLPEASDSDGEGGDLGTHPQRSRAGSGTGIADASMHYLLAAGPDKAELVRELVGDMCEAGCSKIEAALQEASGHSTAVLADGMISLIEVSTAGSRGDQPDQPTIYHYEALFVKWEKVDADPRKARRVRLDSRNRIIYNVPFAVPIEDFPISSTRLIVKDLPVIMFRARSKGRDSMPQFALTLLAHLRARHFAGPLPFPMEGLREHLCVLCQAAQEAEVANVPGPASGLDSCHDLFQCGMCSCIWHASCAAIMCAADRGVCFEGMAFTCPICKSATDES
jgi:hypothetical protein